MRVIDRKGQRQRVSIEPEALGIMVEGKNSCRDSEKERGLRISERIIKQH